eukprot:3633061-Pyramimonas_sp.AAC.1
MAENACQLIFPCVADSQTTLQQENLPTRLAPQKLRVQYWRRIKGARNGAAYNDALKEFDNASVSPHFRLL